MLFAELVYKNTAGTFAYGVVCVLLVLVGYCLYRESPTPVTSVGILVALAGLYLLSQKMMKVWAMPQ